MTLPDAARDGSGRGSPRAVPGRSRHGSPGASGRGRRRAPDPQPVHRRGDAVPSASRRSAEGGGMPAPERGCSARPEVPPPAPGAVSGTARVVPPGNRPGRSGRGARHPSGLSAGRSRSGWTTAAAPHAGPASSPSASPVPGRVMPAVRARAPTARLRNGVQRDAARDPLRTGRAAVVPDGGPVGSAAPGPGDGSGRHGTHRDPTPTAPARPAAPGSPTGQGPSMAPARSPTVATCRGRAFARILTAACPDRLQRRGWRA